MLSNYAASSDWLIWQLADSAFPIGAFAHSGGVEAAWQNGYIRSAADLREFARQILYQSLYATLPFAVAAYAQTQPAEQLDDLLEATLSNHVANRASRAQGQALLATAEKIFQVPAISAWRAEILRSAAPAHFAVVFGVLLRILDVREDTLPRLYLFLLLRSVLSSAVRLGIVGPLHAQQMQTDFAPVMDDFARSVTDFSLENTAQTAPLLEILQLTQDRLYSRLFQS